MCTSKLIISGGISVKQRETASFKGQDSLMHHKTSIIIEFGYNGRRHWLKKGAL